MSNVRHIHTGKLDRQWKTMDEASILEEADTYPQ